MLLVSKASSFILAAVHVLLFALAYPAMPGVENYVKLCRTIKSYYIDIKSQSEECRNKAVILYRVS